MTVFRLLFFFYVLCAFDLTSIPRSHNSFVAVLVRLSLNPHALILCSISFLARICFKGSCDVTLTHVHRRPYLCRDDHVSKSHGGIRSLIHYSFIATRITRKVFSNASSRYLRFPCPPNRFVAGTVGGHHRRLKFFRHLWHRKLAVGLRWRRDLRGDKRLVCGYSQNTCVHLRC